MSAPPLTAADKARLMRRATQAATVVASTLIAVKLAAWLTTDSVAILSTLVDSLLDLGASVLTLFAVRHATTPADKEHRFGHGKAEALAGLGQAAFIAGSSSLVLVEAIRRLFVAEPVQKEWVGLAAMGVSIALTLALVLYQRSVVRRTGSLAIGGDSLHYVGDLLTNTAVIAALLVQMIWRWPYADSLFAFAVVAYLFWNAWQIGRAAYDQLMDRELGDADRQRIVAVARAHPETRAVHDLRTRQAGLSTFIQMHLELDPDMTLVKAHRIADEIEAKLHAAFPHAEIIIHQDPAGYETMPHEG